MLLAYKVVSGQFETVVGGIGKGGPSAFGKYEVGLEVDLPAPRVYAHRTLEGAARRWWMWRMHEPRVVVLEHGEGDGVNRGKNNVVLARFRVTGEVSREELRGLVGP